MFETNLKGHMQLVRVSRKLISESIFVTRSTAFDVSSDLLVAYKFATLRTDWHS